MRVDGDLLIFGGLTALILAGTALLIFAVMRDARQWEEFRAAHACKVVAHINGDVFNTVGVSGNGQVSVGIGSTPNKTGWLCDDGITYFR